MKKINLLFPIEAINREFDYKLLLALRLVKDNVNIIIAQHDYFNKNSHLFEGGVYLGKNMFKSTFPRNSKEKDVDLKYYSNLKKNNILVCHLDEEGAVYFGDENYWKIELGMRLNPKVLSAEDYIFTWGEFQKEYYKSLERQVKVENIISTGHPRLDLNKKNFLNYYKNEVIDLKKNFGNYILINMNMCYANNIFGLNDTFSTRLGYNIEDDKLRMQLVNTWAHFNNTLTEFVKLIHSLSIKYPKRTFVIRPHPAEDKEFYKVVFKGVKNVFVENFGPINIWILGSDMVVHDGCTTGIEAFIGEIPIINYKPIQSSENDLWLPNQLGIKCSSEVEVIEAINKIEVESDFYKNSIKDEEMVKNLIKNIQVDVFEEFVSNFKQIIEKKIKENENDGKLQFYKIQIFEYINNLIEMIKYIARLFFKNKRKRFNAFKAAFPGFYDERIRNKVKISKSKEVEIEIISKRLILVTKKNA